MSDWKFWTFNRFTRSRDPTVLALAIYMCMTMIFSVDKHRLHVLTAMWYYFDCRGYVKTTHWRILSKFISGVRRVYISRPRYRGVLFITLMWSLHYRRFRGRVRVSLKTSTIILDSVSQEPAVLRRWRATADSWARDCRVCFFMINTDHHTSEVPKIEIVTKYMNALNAGLWSTE